MIYYKVQPNICTFVHYLRSVDIKSAGEDTKLQIAEMLTMMRQCVCSNVYCDNGSLFI